MAEQADSIIYAFSSVIRCFEDLFLSFHHHSFTLVRQMNGWCIVCFKFKAILFLFDSDWLFTPHILHCGVLFWLKNDEWDKGRPVRTAFPEQTRSSAAESNKESILDVLLSDILPTSTPISVLEIGSGSGQHIVYFAAHFPLASFQPSDMDRDYLKSIQAHIDEYEVNAFTKNVLPPLTIDLLAPFTVKEQSFDFVYCCNVIHITPIECTQRLFALAEHVLKPEGSLITYGPYALAGGGRITPESNRRFHGHLQMQDSRWGLKGIDELSIIALAHHIRLKQQFDVPYNNKILWWQKEKHWLMLVWFCCIWLR